VIRGQEMSVSSEKNMGSRPAEELLGELTDILSQELALHNGLRDELLVELEQEGRLKGREMLLLQQRKYNWIGRIEAIEERRIHKVAELARSWSESADNLTLKRIISRVEPDMAAQLDSCHNGLLALVEEVRRLARETGANAQARLKAVEATLSVIGEAARMHPTYSGAGRLQQQKPSFKTTSA